MKKSGVESARRTFFRANFSAASMRNPLDARIYSHWQRISRSLASEAIAASLEWHHLMMKWLRTAVSAFARAASGATMLSLRPDPDILYCTDRHDNDEVGRSDSYTGMRRSWERPIHHLLRAFECDMENG